MNKIYNDDCFNILPTLEEESVKLVLVDLPYGQTALKWDTEIDLKLMWKQLKKCCYRRCIYVFFCTTKYGVKLINSNPKWFKYDLVWEKSRKVGFLSANKMPLRKHEMIYVFSDDYENKKGLNNELEEYSKRLFKSIGKTKKEIENKIGSMCHFFGCYGGKQFRIPIEKKYKLLIKNYNIDKFNYFKTYEEIEKLYSSITYNPQKIKGKPYKTTGGDNQKCIYGDIKNIITDNKGDRHPTTILKFNNPSKVLHKTQKPVDLCEWLIKSYSNEGDLILDFTAGSMSTAIACINTKRNYIMIEKDKKIFEIGKKRIEKLILQ